MCRLRFASALTLCFGTILTLAGRAVTPPQTPPPQTARQALLEILLAKTPAPFQKHLPDSAQSLIKKDSGVFPLRDLSEALSELRLAERKLETFDTGPTLLRSENPGIEQTVEVQVESESDDGGEDELQLVVHIYRAGRLLPCPLCPRSRAG
jgi:hypothetical protein